MVRSLADRTFQLRLDLGCAKIAAAVRDLDGDELLEFVGRTEEFSPEEEDELLLANSWCAGDF